MKRIITLSILCFSLTGLKAQISNIDSLEAVLRNEKQDSTRVFLFNGHRAQLYFVVL